MAQAAFGAPDKVAELVRRNVSIPRSVEAAGAVDVKNTSTSSLENAQNAFSTATTDCIVLDENEWYKAAFERSACVVMKATEECVRIHGSHLRAGKPFDTAPATPAPARP